ncbi:DNA sulfur modification protein DndD [Mucilaginibacter sp. 14171R-50]|uniref:DNA sulfur modification protein DndD n=1 Tax=Mucilaginibacter sp. 14171R-50 TaxID=2703789 RepID=UPI00138BEA38|nr:DNA sulfur modification protein DndD [Mucilaginibacter sp. 14171R-50]QHS55937.1 DNA sulfur modification protein DndD [Mucilaginibacter sp. 14171R-50]
MFINKISLYNFRVYYGNNALDLSTDINNNISVIAGNNGFGKTSFLTALVWGLYGKLMSDVDERYRQDIMESGGYKRYCEKLMNRLAISEADEKIALLQEEITQTANSAAKLALKKKLTTYSSFSVGLQLSGLMIPSVPCEFVEIKRTYDINTHQESIEILIDGKINELTKGVGPEIFINDFILPKEIAKFFFFDAEKIVALADINTAEEKRYLSQAYAEVLGIKKYTDLKGNLQNLRLRLRQKSAVKSDRDVLEKLSKQLTQNKKLAQHYLQQLEERADIIHSKKIASDKYQEQLIREGSSITLEELKRLKEQQVQYTNELLKTKSRFNELLELAPFAMLAGKVAQVKQQLEAEMNNSTASRTLLQDKFSAISSAMESYKSRFKVSPEMESSLLDLIKSELLPERKQDVKTLLDFTLDQQNRFFAIYDNLKNAYSKTFRQLVMEQKRLQTMYGNVQRKLQNAESKERDPVIMEIRQSKDRIDEEIKSLENEIAGINAKKQNAETEIQILSRKISELSKKVDLEDTDKEKDAMAERLIEKLDKFINQLKLKKKINLEKSILRELNRLMHKDDFVSRVNVVISGDLIDIELYDHQRQFIDKELLSKGEQQLYATALLKALVDESNIRFPVFIDSPLQKFDKQHSRNIIQEFYPFLSGQVVLFPLLQKELNEQEYNWMLPRVGKAYLINQNGKYHSVFEPVQADQLFVNYNQRQEHVQ